MKDACEILFCYFESVIQETKHEFDSWVELILYWVEVTQAIRFLISNLIWL